MIDIRDYACLICPRSRKSFLKPSSLRISGLKCMNSCFWYAKNYLHVYKVWLGTMLNQDLTLLEKILARSIWLHLQAYLREYFHPPSCHSCEEPWAKVPGWVHGTATVHSQGASKNNYKKSYCNWLQALGYAVIFGVKNSKYSQKKNSCWHHLAKAKKRILNKYV